MSEELQAMRYHANKIFERVEAAAEEYEQGRSALGFMEDIAESALYLRSKMDAELSAIKGGGEVVHWRALLDDGQRPSQLNTHMHIVGFTNLRAAEDFVAARLDIDGWTYRLEPLYLHPPVVAEAEAVTEVMRFQLKHPLTGETHTVEFTRAEVADGLEDSLYEKLAPLVCNCDGEADHECGDYIHDFDLAPATPSAQAAPPASGAVPVSDGFIGELHEYLDNCAQFDPAYPPETQPDNRAAALLLKLRALLAKGVAS